MMDDPIVDEVHKVREKLLAECGGDLKKLLARYKAQESQDRSRVVTSVKESHARDNARP